MKKILGPVGAIALIILSLIVVGWSITFVFFAIAMLVFAIHFLRKSHKLGFTGQGVIAVVLALMLLAGAAWVAQRDINSSEASATQEEIKELTYDLDAYNACPDGVSAEEDVEFYVRGENITHPWSLTPPLPQRNPDGVIDALFGSEGYACKDPAVAVAMAQVQEGLLPFTELEDTETVNAWIRLFVANTSMWEVYVDETVKRFDGLSYEPKWRPEDGDATFLIADANEGEPYAELKQREDGVTDHGLPVYRFKLSYGDSMLLKELVLVQSTGWLGLPEGQFARTPIIELDEPLFHTKEEPPDSQESTTSEQSESKDEDKQDKSGSKDKDDKSGTSKGKDKGNKPESDGQDKGKQGGDTSDNPSGGPDKGTCEGCGKDNGGGTGGDKGNEVCSGCNGDRGGGKDKGDDGCGNCPTTTRPRPEPTQPPDTTWPPTTTAPPPTTKSPPVTLPCLPGVSC